jgi:two-component system nitrate/nitrite response regulator NarL
MSQSDYGPCDEPATTLTPRHAELAELVSEGLTNGEIAEKLGLSRAAVAIQILELLNTLDLPNRLRLAVWFLRQPR